MSEHAKLSPSSRHRWSLCPGSVREEAKYIELPSNPSAIDGTHTHTLLEQCIKLGLIDAKSFIGLDLTDHEGTFKVDAERAERVQFALDYVKERLATHDLRVISETRVNPVLFFDRNDLDGTVDIQLIGGDNIEIIDYKDGMNVVDACDNPQLEQYGIGALAVFEPSTYAKNICMTIIQPKLRLKGLVGIDSYEVSIADFLKKVVVIGEQAAATDDPDAPLVPGETQCKWCRAKGSCTALASQSLEKSGIVFAKIDVATQAADTDPHTMSDEQILKILEAAPLVRQMIEGVEAEAQRRLEAGQTIDGIKLVKGRGTRSWALDDDKTAEVLTKMGIPKASLWKTSLISPAQAEKVTWEKRDGSTKQLTEKQLATLKGEYIKKSDGKLTVALASDDRPAVNMAIDFAPVYLPSFLQ